MSKRQGNPDRVVRTRVREPVGFQSLSENRAIKLSSVLDYAGRSHFAPWHKILPGAHDFTDMSGIFTPLVFVELETTDLQCEAMERVEVRGESYLGRALDASGEIRNIVREGRHKVIDRDGKSLASAKMINVFTRYDKDPARRRVTELPVEMGLGPYPQRVIEVPTVGTLIDRSRNPDFVESANHTWHYGQTDPNRHVSGMFYVRVMEEYMADVLHDAGHNLARLFFARARIVYRKPSFRGEVYRRAAWLRSEAPLVLSGAFFKADDPEDAEPAVAIEMTSLHHDER